MSSPPGTASSFQAPARASFHDEHEAFAASRVSQYVFVPTRDAYMATLDQHADTLECDVKPPLVLVGNEGSGKSALLANWVHKRREHKHRDEFLFQHFVGCTTQSLQLAHTLFRLETALKEFFQLREMKVPDNETELRWALNRFLEAAAKKHNPARIVIILDGIHRLKADAATDGLLYWLPTELPPCVRFILSTVEFERLPRSQRAGGASPKAHSASLHPTFVELQRRKCPILRVEPLGVSTRHSVLVAFTQLHAARLELSEQQQFRVETAASCAQPMFLRSLLQALRLASQLSAISVDDLLDRFLACATAHELIETCLNVCCVDQQQQSYDRLAALLGHMMSVIYVSRSGLSEVEIWEIMRLQGQCASEEQQFKLLTILKDFTMVVNGMFTFSHEVYREVVYAKYIASREGLINLHKTLARYFDQLKPCDRKLVALPYHLEMAGLWSQVKNCLTEIEMFQLWWTPKFKSDFIKFWVSLTLLNQPGENKHAVKHGSHALGGPHKKDGDGAQSSSRPSYDIVEEYVKSLDEYRARRHPSDEEVADIILEIGDFLLEFATLGYEKDADVPALIHPKVLSEDLKAIGVPYIETDEEGRSSLVFPVLDTKQKAKLEDGQNQVLDVVNKAIDDVPFCSTYYYSRWMWIQFPYVALGNCGDRYDEGVNKKAESNLDSSQKKNETSASPVRSSTAASLKRFMKTMPAIKSQSGASVDGDGEQSQLSKSWSQADVTLPRIKFNRKAARSFPRVVKDPDVTEAPETSSKLMQRILALQDNVQNYREEYDFLVRMKAILGRRVQDLKDQLVDLQRTAQSVTAFDDAKAAAEQRCEDAERKWLRAKAMHKHLQSLATMCDRHPANVPALITELQDRLEQDDFLLGEIRKRLWEQKFERQTHASNVKVIKQLLHETQGILEKRYNCRYAAVQELEQQVKENEKLAASGAKRQKDQDAFNRRSSSQEVGADKAALLAESSSLSGMKQQQAWDHLWQSISQRTGIAEPEVFFVRFSNAAALTQQIEKIKRVSEQRLETLKNELAAVENERGEEVQHETKFGGVQSSKEHKQRLADRQQSLRRLKEKAEAMEQLKDRVFAGLAHISDILFIPKADDDATEQNLVKDIDTVLGTLLDAREKQLQQQGGSGNNPGSLTAAGAAGAASVASVMAETHANRSPELDFVIAKHESPKVRLPAQLPSKPIVAEEDQPHRHLLLSPRALVRPEDDADGSSGDDERPWDRGFVKTKSLEIVRTTAKRNARHKSHTSPAAAAPSTPLHKTV